MEHLYQQIKQNENYIYIRLIILNFSDTYLQGLKRQRQNL